jgi:hypothetical protein
MTPPLLWKIYIYENVLLILYYKYQNNLQGENLSSINRE